jgi:outer membrane receptor protein involved in Fe transport
MLGDSWKDLDPEIVDHYETGVSYLFGSVAAVDLTWFYNDGKDRYVVVPPPPPPPVYENIGHYATKGVEAALAGIADGGSFPVFRGHIPEKRPG